MIYFWTIYFFGFFVYMIGNLRNMADLNFSVLFNYMFHHNFWLGLASIVKLFCLVLLAWTFWPVMIVLDYLYVRNNNRRG